MLMLPRLEPGQERWIAAVLNDPVQVVVQADSRCLLWGYTDEIGRYLRVVTLEDGQTVHNAFPDTGFTRSFTP
jgi:hypothetical protein